MKFVLIFAILTSYLFADNDDSSIMSVGGQSDAVALEKFQTWHRINAPKKQSILFVGLQEGKWAREVLKVGEWQPLNFFEIQDKWLDVGFGGLKIENHRAILTYYLRNSNGKVFTAKLNYFDGGEDGYPTVIVRFEGGVLTFDIPYTYIKEAGKAQEQCLKKFVFKFFDGKDELIENTSISSLCVMFKWSKVNIDKF